MRNTTEIVNEAGNWKLRYWAIFIGQALSLLGSSLTQFVLMWWITDKTESVAYLSFAGMAALLPQALLSPLGGVLADRFSRRLLMILSDAVSAICMVILIVLFLSDAIALWHIFLMMAIRGAMQAFQGPASMASTAMLVPKSFLTRAAGLNQSLQGIITVGSAPLGAFAISVMPIGWALSIDVFTALLGIIPLLLFTIPQISRHDSKSSIASIKVEFKEGLSLVWKHPALKRLYGLLGIVVMVVMPSYTLLPLLVKDYFQGGAMEVGLMEGFGGLGMVLGGGAVALFPPRRKIIWILAGSALSCLMLTAVAFTPAGFLWIAVVWWWINGLAYICSNAPLTALLQTIIPNQLQGRALSLLNTIVALAAPVGLALATPIGEMIGIRWLFVIVGLLGCVVSLLGFTSVPLKKIDKSRAGQI